MSDDRPQSPAAAFKLLRSREMRQADLATLNAIIALGNWREDAPTKGIAHVGNPKLARQLGVKDVGSARRRVREAAAAGLLIRHAAKGGYSAANRYELNWSTILALPRVDRPGDEPEHERTGCEQEPGRTRTGLAIEPERWRTGSEHDNPGAGARNPGAGARNPGAGAPHFISSCSSPPPSGAESNDAIPPAVDDGGGDAHTGAGEFDGDLAGAIEALKSMRVNRAEHLARQAGSERAVLYAVEQAKAPGVKNRAAFAARLISDGERPHNGWRSPAEQASTPTHPAAVGDRSAQATEHQLARARNEAELALIARFPDIADAAAEQFIAEGRDVDGHVARKGRTHRVAREAVLAAIEAETGETPHPGATSNARPNSARELAG